MTASRFRLFFRCLISAGLVLFVLRKINWTALGTVLAQLDFRWALLGSVSTLGLIAALTLRWWIFLRQQEINLAYVDLFFLTWAGQFFNSILPGSTGGDVVKIHRLCQLAPDRKAAAAATVLVDRLSALAALLVLMAAALLINPGPLKLLFRMTLTGRATGYMAVAFGILGTCGVWLGYRLTTGTKLRGRIARTLAATKNNFVITAGLLATVLLAFVIHLLNFLILYFFARALSIQITYGQVLLMTPVILFLVMIPVTINGHGLREVLLITYFTYMGIAVASHPEIQVRETAVAFSLVAVANDLLWSLPGGLLYLLNLRRSSLTGISEERSRKLSRG